MVLTLKTWANSLLGLFYPRICAACDTQLLQQEELVCYHCERHFPKTLFARYPDNPIEKLFWGRVNIKAAASLYFFSKGDGIQKIMHQLKYKNRKDIGIYFGQLIGVELTLSSRFEGVDWIIPVPLHPKKEYQRGFNQSALIAQGIEEKTAWKMVPALIRIENTASQTRKGKYDRWLNVGSSFRIDPKYSVEGKNILLIDDVITTGATLESCVQCLLNGDAKSISVASLACA
jgi:ComF family protein